MAKRKTRRRFDEPRAGVSQAMVEAEAKELQREVDSYLLQSLTQLREALQSRQRMYRQMSDALAVAVGGLPEREQLAAQCMLSRDLYLVLATHTTFLQGRAPESPRTVVPSQAVELPFSEWLFPS